MIAGMVASVFFSCAVVLFVKGEKNAREWLRSSYTAGSSG